MKTGVDFIAKKRREQITKHRWSRKHDDEHTDGSLAVVAAVLACDGTDASVTDPLGRGSEDDPWGLLTKHGYQAEGSDEVNKLAIAGALIAAEIDRVLRIRKLKKLPA